VRFLLLSVTEPRSSRAEHGASVEFQARRFRCRRRRALRALLPVVRLCPPVGSRLRAGKGIVKAQRIGRFPYLFWTAPFAVQARTLVWWRWYVRHFSRVAVGNGVETAAGQWGLSVRLGRVVRRDADTGRAQTGGWGFCSRLLPEFL